MQKLNGNQLKIIAAMLMVIDHVGYILFPEIDILRIIGRVSFPIFAFFIAEGCRYTRNKRKYLLQMYGMGMLCLVGQYFFSGEVFGNILITFSLSICIIYGLQNLKSAVYSKTNRKQIFLWMAVTLVLVATTYVVCKWMKVDYGFWGVLVPVFVEVFDITGQESLRNRLEGLFIGLTFLSLFSGGIQWYCMLALLPLMVYNEQRGTLKMKHFFYWFYPAHIVVLEGIAILLR